MQSRQKNKGDTGSFWRLSSNIAGHGRGPAEGQPVTLVCLDSKFWAFAGKGAKVDQIHKNCKMEFCLPLREGQRLEYVRALGKAMVVLDRATKEKMAGRVRFFKEHWTSPKDPNYALLELKIDRLEYLRPGEMLAEKCVM